MDTKEKFELKDFNPAKNKALFIEASAGTGKTFTIQLLVAKLIAEEVSLKKILIVTYTEKAAGELKDRIRKKIVEVLDTGLLDKNAEKAKWNDVSDKLGFFNKAYRDVDNAAIFTIHSFCQKALKEYAYDAGRPFDVSMVDDSAVKELVERRIREEWINDADFKKLVEIKGSVDSVIDDLEDRLIKAVDLYKGSQNGKEIVKRQSTDLCILGKALSESEIEKILIAEDFATLRKAIDFENEIKLLEAHPEARFSKTGNNGNAKNFVEAMKAWKKGSVLYSKGSFKEDYARDNFSGDLFNAFAYFRDLREIISHDLYNHKLEKFLSICTKDLFNEWQKNKSDSKLQSYNDMILSVHDAVLNGSGLKEKLQAEYTYAIIDEFQDTNQLQWDIFKTLFWNQSDHSIYVVGDPKQSIYSFQSADVNVYNKAIEDIKQENGRRLACNHRSTNGIIHACNKLFEKDFFTPAKGMNKLIDFTESISPDEKDPPESPKAPPQYCGKIVPSIWLCKGSDKGVNEHAFARAAVKQIVDWCSLTEETDESGKKKTKLQVFDKDHSEKLRNLKLKDVAVLARSRTEMQVIESYMKQAHLPFTQYKESNLFKSRESAEWISLFRALNATDFSGWNRKLLNEVLITDFFKDGLKKTLAKEGQDLEKIKDFNELHLVESEVFDSPEIWERKCLNEWRALALKKRYAEMLEHIYDDTCIDDRLTDRASLQELARLRQIGNYAIDYLYNHNCSLEDLVRHLDGLARFNESADDENGDLVEKGSDSDMVQVMTIHASKGLEFPVVISVAGFKGYYDQAEGPFLYHDNNDIYLGFGKNAKDARKKEELEEWKRLFYVDFTRASSILVLPNYEKWNKDPNYAFLKSAITRITTDDKDKNYKVKDYIVELKSIPKDEWDPKQLQETVEKILLDSNECKDSKNKASDYDDQKKAMSALQGKLGGKAILQYSYSNLAKRKGDDNIDANVVEALEGRSDSAEESETSLSDDANEQNKNIDLDVVEYACKEESISSTEPSAEIQKWKEVEKTYPRGNKVGNVLHNTLEWLQFSKLFEENTDKDSYKTFDAACSYSDLIEKLKDEFKEQSLPIGEHESDWIKLSIWFIWNTLHAKLPVINGGEFKDAEPFTLASLPDSNHKPEVQFGLTAELDKKTNSYLHKFCKGFIDLLFVRPDADGNKRFSILDWKSDYLEEYSAKAIKEKVDKEYSVQRVLYSYCLIQWLKQFYGPGTQENLKDEQAIFKKHFGGIYYAFLRGTDGQTQRGIYAQTWEDFKKLEDAYIEVKNLMKKGSDNEEEN